MNPLIRLTTLAAFATVPLLAVAQDAYPSKPVRMIVPFAPGTMADVLPRLVAEKLSAQWGQPIVVENRPGAAGNVGAEAVARAEPDGYTLLAAPPPPIAINQSLYPRLGYDPAALVPVTVIGATPNVLAVHPKVEAASLQDLIALARSRPGRLSYASTGSGGTPHLTAERFKALIGASIVHVPYKGAGPALADLLAGRVDMMFVNLGDALRHRELRVVAVASKQRVPSLPDVPALSETFPGFVSTTWYAIVAPQKTPAALAERLSQAIASVVRSPELMRRLRELNIEPVASSPDATAAFIAEEVKRWRAIIVEAGVKVDP
ncbi:MAG TPA: tripartite tricarboxylate transporter substrate binding protein [Burkholderiales bacterium]|nr:tripartite tricarboxylate transporter substrate binding protein [Burkholderiales bacterium]